MNVGGTALSVALIALAVTRYRDPIDLWQRRSMAVISMLAVTSYWLQWQNKTF